MWRRRQLPPLAAASLALGCWLLLSEASPAAGGAPASALPPKEEPEAAGAPRSAGGAQVAPEGQLLQRVACRGTGEEEAEARSLSGSGSGGHGAAQHHALIFLFNALVIGTAIMHINALFPGIQLTVVLFIVGMVVSFFFEGLHLKEHTGVFGESYTMWMNIDPHLLLFALLPTLLAGDAMTIDTAVAKRVAYQCLYLAGPGVIVQAMLIAVFLKYYLSWDFYLSLTTSSILCATDPVAVVALLKELGASPMLTVLIQGESLLNDGTAIVLYTVSYNLLSGVHYDFADVVFFLVKTAMMAWALGMFIGYFFFSWIRLAGNRMKESSGMIQISLTLSCAYWSFIMAEGVFKMSGVLATVAASLVLAHHMWPHIVCEESMHHAWHTFETMGNIIIFFLAGALTGNVMVSIAAIDYLHLIVIYLMLIVVRTGFTFMSRPVLRLLSPNRQGVSKAEAAVMCWGGLRGAVGLALAIQVYKARAPDSHDEMQIGEDDGQRVLFYVSGTALLTTVINATTAPILVRWLGITALPRTQQKLLRMIHWQLVHWSRGEDNPASVTEGLKEMLNEVSHNIDKESGSGSKSSLLTRVSGQSGKRGTSEASDGSGGKLRRQGRNFFLNSMDFDIRGKWGHKEQLQAQDNSSLVATLLAAEQEYRSLSQMHLDLMEDLPHDCLLGKVGDIVSLVTSAGVDIEMATSINRAFLSMVRHCYWRQMEEGNIRPGSDEGNCLLTSIELAQSPPKADLTDFEGIIKEMPQLTTAEGVEWWMVLSDEMPEASSRNQLNRCVNSMYFNLFISVTIILNGIYVCVDEAVRNESNNGHAVWIVFEVIFNFIFVAEFVLKFVDMRCNYFKSVANCFDFLLVVLGIVGLVMTIMASESSNSQTSSQARIMRVSRIFRVLRFLRVFRLIHTKMAADKDVSPTAGCHMQRMTILQNFINAHLWSQVHIIKYFGGNGKIDLQDEVEIGRCVLQSQVEVYGAFKLAVAERERMGPALHEELTLVYKRKEVTEGLEKFVKGAHSHGAISAREAESILHPLRHQIGCCIQKIDELGDGIVSTDPRETARKMSYDCESRIRLSQELDDKAHGPCCADAGANQGPRAVLPGQVSNGTGTPVPTDPGDIPLRDTSRKETTT